MLLTPTGKVADTIDRIMLLAIWTNHLQAIATDPNIAKNSEIIVAGIGKPTFPINIAAAKTLKKYWNDYYLESEKARHVITNAKIKMNNPQHLENLANSAISYGDPHGDKDARGKMAIALMRWYHTIISSNHILFTVGGAAALRVISNVLNREHPKSRIITPLPYYSLYAELFGKDNLHLIEVMQTPGYRLTAKNFAISLIKAEKLAEKDMRQVSAFLMCDPNNPLGSVIDKSELIKIVEILKNKPDMLIILDEAYAEMCFIGDRHTSLFAIAPREVRDRIILIRSATKALSAAGERMGIIVTSNESLMAKLVQENIKLCGHAPRSLQHAFAEAMDKLDKKELDALEAYYKPQIDYVIKRLENMGAAMPDPGYKIMGSFYVLADFSDLLGLELTLETKKALNKTGKITTDEDIAYYLLFKDSVMIAPLSYFGVASNKGYMRITCSNGNQTITLMNRLESRLQIARKIKQDIALQQLKARLDELKLFNIKKHNELYSRMLNLIEAQNDISHCTAGELKKNNLLLSKLLLETNRFLAYLPGDRHFKEAIIIQSFFRMVSAKRKYEQLQSEVLKRKKNWTDYLDTINSLPWPKKRKLMELTRPNDINFIDSQKVPEHPDSSRPNCYNYTSQHRAR